MNFFYNPKPVKELDDIRHETVEKTPKRGYGFFMTLYCAIPLFVLASAGCPLNRADKVNINETKPIVLKIENLKLLEDIVYEEELFGWFSKLPYEDLEKRFGYLEKKYENNSVIYDANNESGSFYLKLEDDFLVVSYISADEKDEFTIQICDDSEIASKGAKEKILRHVVIKNRRHGISQDPYFNGIGYDVQENGTIRRFVKEGLKITQRRASVEKMERWRKVGDEIRQKYFNREVPLK